MFITRQKNEVVQLWFRIGVIIDVIRVQEGMHPFLLSALCVQTHLLLNYGIFWHISPFYL